MRTIKKYGTEDKAEDAGVTEYVYCGWCGMYVDEADTTVIGKGYNLMTMCDECAGGAHECKCGEWVHDDAGVVEDGDLLNEDGTYTCSDCDALLASGTPKEVAREIIKII